MTAIEVGVFIAHEFHVNEREQAPDPAALLHMPLYYGMHSFVHGTDAAWRSDRRRAWPIRLGRRIRRLFA